MRAALREIGLPYIFVNESAEIAQAEDGIFNSNDFRYKKITSPSTYIEDTIDFINHDIEVQSLQKAILLMSWLPQFTEGEFLKFKEIGNPIAISIVGLTTLTSSSATSTAAVGPRYIFQEYFQAKPYDLLWVGEKISRENSQNLRVRFLPEYANTTLVLSNRTHSDISFFGHLVPYRGISEILITSLFNPKLRIRIQGYSFKAHRIFRPLKFKVFNYGSWKNNPVFAVVFSLISLLLSLLRFLPNVDFSPSPFESESDLDQAMSESKCVFLCMKFPFGSGIMTKSLSAGIPVIWNGQNGQAIEFLNLNFPEGKFNYGDIFIPGKITKKLAQLAPPLPLRAEMWAGFVEEIRQLSRLID
jgi:hypothetical protein